MTNDRSSISPCLNLYDADLKLCVDNKIIPYLERNKRKLTFLPRVNRLHSDFKHRLHTLKRASPTNKIRIHSVHKLDFTGTRRKQLTDNAAFRNNPFLLKTKSVNMTNANITFNDNDAQCKQNNDIAPFLMQRENKKRLIKLLYIEFHKKSLLSQNIIIKGKPYSKLNKSAMINECIG